MATQDIAILFFSLGLLLASARVLGELAQRLGQPAFVGELLAGVLLGPTVLGRVAPHALETLFSTTGPRAAVWDSLTMLSIVLLLVVIGMQVQLSTLWRRGRTSVAVAGFVIPFALALVAAWLAPHMLGCELDADPGVFAFFFATAMSISAPAVITKTLVDLNLFRSDMGRLTVAAAVFNNLIGWMVFAGVLGLLANDPAGPLHVARTIGLTIAFAAIMLTIGRRLIHAALPWILAHTSWPGGVLGFAIALALLAAGLTEWIGIHAIFGALLVGIAVGDSSHLRPPARRTILDFISFIFAPLFFAGVGLRIDFVEKFDPLVVGSVAAIGCIGKLVGCGLTARLSGLKWSASSALGIAMNARGAMAIVLGFLALENGLIRQRMCVALVVMAVVTSMLSEPLIKRLLKRRRTLKLADYVSPAGFTRPLEAVERWSAMEQLAASLQESPSEAWLADSALWGGDVRVEWAGPNQEVAVCLVGMDALAAPRVAVGVADRGIDFGRLAEFPVRVVVLVATPAGCVDDELALEDDIHETFAGERTLREVCRAATLTELLAAIKASDKALAPEEPAEVPVA
jgi:Kef-type K+ transport system membrane component KefB